MMKVMKMVRFGRLFKFLTLSLPDFASTESTFFALWLCCFDFTDFILPCGDGLAVRYRDA